jgi:hypothetical protein
LDFQAKGRREVIDRNRVRQLAQEETARKAVAAQEETSGMDSNESRLSEFLDRIEPDVQTMERITPEVLRAIAEFHASAAKVESVFGVRGGGLDQSMYEVIWNESGCPVSQHEYGRLVAIFTEACKKRRLHGRIVCIRLRTRRKISEDRRKLNDRLARSLSVMYRFTWNRFCRTPRTPEELTPESYLEPDCQAWLWERQFFRRRKARSRVGKLG